MPACRRCGQPRRAGLRRGLCRPCYRLLLPTGGLEEFPLLARSAPWPSELLLSEWEFLAGQGFTRAQAAERLRVKRDTLDRAIERAARLSVTVSLDQDRRSEQW